MKNKIKYLGSAAVALLLISYGCQKDNNEISLGKTKENSSPTSYSPYKGMQLTDLQGEARKYAVSFSIGNKIYMGLGFNNAGALKDFWEWHYDAGYWKWKMGIIQGFMGMGPDNGQMDQKS